MSNHGVVAYGEDIHVAYMRMETVEHFAKIALVTHLLGKQKADGSFTDGQSLYDHAIATAALAEAYGMTHDPAYKKGAQAAVTYLVRAQHARLAHDRVHVYRPAAGSRSELPHRWLCLCHRRIRWERRYPTR